MHERLLRNQRLFFFCAFAGVLVIRPDSGNPPDVVVKVLNILGKWAYLPNAVWVEFIYLFKEVNLKIQLSKI